MYLLDPRIAGIMILVLLAALVAVKRAATGTILDRPTGSLTAWAADVYNLIFLLIVNPAAAILLITGSLESADPTHLAVSAPGQLVGLQAAGLLLYLTGCFLMVWALISLGRGFQAGGSAPRASDQMMIAGAYRFLRHPMYTAALCLSLGLACLTQSLAAFAVFGIYLLLIVLLIPVEEEGLRRAYGDGYAAYQRKVSRLIPHLY